MDKKSKALSWIIALAIIASIGFTFYRTVIVKDFVMTGEEEVQATNETTEEPVDGSVVDEVVSE
jgi:phosphotransferase system  glucose/maltose/N-acetylglucosamine-specific IIC component